MRLYTLQVCIPPEYQHVISRLAAIEDRSLSSTARSLIRDGLMSRGVMRNNRDNPASDVIGVKS